MGSWTFLTNHARVLAHIADAPGVRLRDIAAHVGITERAAHRIIGELEEDGYLTRHRVGARNFYEVHPDQPLGRPEIEPDRGIGELLRLLLRAPRPGPPAAGTPRREPTGVGADPS